jgi:hypothetical protein
MLTTLIFGTFMGAMSKFLCPPTVEQAKELKTYETFGTDPAILKK